MTNHQTYDKNWGLGTRLLKAAKADIGMGSVKPHIAPLYQTVNFEYPDAEQGLAIFDGKKEGYIYTRYRNPSTDLFAHMVAVLEGAEKGLSAASGMAAISSVFMAYARQGDHIISSKDIYGGTRAFFSQDLAAMGVDIDLVDITDIEQVANAIRPCTRIIYTEILGNPNLVVADIAGLSKLAKNHDIKLVVDNTFTPPPVAQPIEMGADIVIHSATKYIGGHGDLVGGVILGCNRELKDIAAKLVNFGGCLSPFNAWLGVRGMKTLPLRLERQCENAFQLARFLEHHSAVNKVFYPGLKSHPFHKLADAQLKGFGAMLSFEVKGGFDAAKALIDVVRVCRFTVSLGEIDTLIIHPASTSHVSLSAEDRKKIGITDGLLRLSVGIENYTDLENDLMQALDKLNHGKSDEF
jgi:methionine-gamma-lyase